MASYLVGDLLRRSLRHCLKQAQHVLKSRRTLEDFLYGLFKHRVGVLVRR